MDRRWLSFSPSIKLVMAAFAACALACAASAGPAQKGASMIAIDKMDIGRPPAGFEFARTGQGGPGQWAVVSDPDAAGGKAIEQTSNERTDYRFPLAIYAAATIKDGTVALRFKPVGGKVDQAGGIAMRLADADNYYVVRANALEDNVRFYRVVNGRRQELAGVDIKVSANAWHTLTLKAEGENFTVTYDGKSLFTAGDRTFSAAGKVALWTKADSVTRFDSIEIAPLP